MNKLVMTVAGATLVAGTFLMSGCATTSATAGKDPVAEWQASRMTTNSVPLNTTLKTVQLAARALEVSIWPIQVETYGLVDDAHAKVVGRKVYMAVQNDVNAGAKMNDVLAKLSPADLKNYKEYAAYVRQLDYEKNQTLGQSILKKMDPLVAGAAGLLATAQADPDYASQGLIDQAMETKQVGKDVAMLKDKLADSKKALDFWFELNREDNEAKKFMAQYPVK